jgi:hypothetical protein
VQPELAEEFAIQVFCLKARQVERMKGMLPLRATSIDPGLTLTQR